MDGRSKKIHQNSQQLQTLLRPLQHKTSSNSNNKNKCLQCNKNMVLKRFKISATLSKKEKIKMCLIKGQLLQVNKALIQQTKVYFQHKLAFKKIYNGPHLSGSKNGKNPYFCQTLRHAFHTPTIKQWPSEIN